MEPISETLQNIIECKEIFKCRKALMQTFHALALYWSQSYNL